MLFTRTGFLAAEDDGVFSERPLHVARLMMRESLVMSKSAPLSELLILDLEIESSFLLFSVIKKGGKNQKRIEKGPC